MSAQLSLLPSPRAKTPRPRNFFDTSRLTLPDLVAAVRVAHYQDDQVLAVFRCHMVMTPSRCLQVLDAAGVRILITSVRRSIATLTAAGALRKLDQTVPGPYGSPEHLWELAPAPRAVVQA